MDRLEELFVLELVTWKTEGEIGEVGCSGMEVDFLILISGIVGGGGLVVFGVTDVDFGDVMVMVVWGLSATGAVDGIRTISRAGRLSTGGGCGTVSVILVTLIDDGGSKRLGTGFFVFISLV